MTTPYDFKTLGQDISNHAISSSTMTIFRPPTWFHCDEQSFLTSQVVSIWWNVRNGDSQTIKTQVSLTNGVMINIFGQNRKVFASQCLNLKVEFENSNFDSKLIFKI